MPQGSQSVALHAAMMRLKSAELSRDILQLFCGSLTLLLQLRCDGSDGNYVLKRKNNVRNEITTKFFMQTLFFFLRYFQLCAQGLNLGLLSQSGVGQLIRPSQSSSQLKSTNLKTQGVRQYSARKKSNG